MIKVIAFDYAGVVASGPMTEWLKTNLDPNHDKFNKYVELAHKWDVGEMSLEEVYQALSLLTGIPKNLVWGQFYEKSTLNKDAIDIIKKLKQIYKVFLFSNFVGEVLRKVLDKQKIAGLFDEIIISSEYKLQKPSQEFFEILVSKAGVNTNEALFVDDSLRNTDAARSFGSKAIQFLNAEQLREDLEKNGIKT